jgi:hypothetical protein
MHRYQVIPVKNIIKFGTVLSNLRGDDSEQGQLKPICQNILKYLKHPRCSYFRYNVTIATEYLGFSGWDKQEQVEKISQTIIGSGFDH